MVKKQPLYPHVPKSKVERLPETLPDDNMSLPWTREHVTQTIISNLVQAEVLLPSDESRYRKTLETYDNIALLRIMVNSHQLKEARND